MFVNGLGLCSGRVGGLSVACQAAEGRPCGQDSQWPEQCLLLPLHPHSSFVQECGPQERAGEPAPQELTAHGSTGPSHCALKMWLFSFYFFLIYFAFGGAILLIKSLKQMKQKTVKSVR